MNDIIINNLINTKLWLVKKQRPYENANLFHIYSNMRGYSDGRYRLEILKLKRIREGSLYKVSIFWTPYDPNNLVFKGRFNSFDELKDLINKVNKDLFNSDRIYE